MSRKQSIKVAAATPKVWLTDVDRNAAEVIRLCGEAAERGAQIVVFPEMCLTGATCGDLCRQDVLLDAAQRGAGRVAEATAGLDITVVLGLPLCTRDGWMSGAAIIRGGEFVESDPRFVVVTGPDIPSDLPKGTRMVVHIAAVPEMVTAFGKRRDTLAQLTWDRSCAYVFCPAGYGESTTDAVYAGGALVYSRGALLSEGQRFAIESTMAEALIDTAVSEAPVQRRSGGLTAHPFVPDDPDELARRCEDILSIQVTGLRTRMEHIGSRGVVLGISGGLDSTLALLVTALTFDSLGYPRSGITAVTMPGFGTSTRTHDNASALMAALGVSAREIPIGPAVSQHFTDIGHDPAVKDVTFENAQARERTQILMDLANETGGMVVGTGDLSELALGWCTYNGDHMSMYGVNADVPKTLMQAMVRWAAEHRFPEAHDTLLDIVDTPISPELTPADKEGNIAQKTEDLVGPYELHDFFLYLLVRHGLRPREIKALAVKSFEGKYDEAVIDKWLRKFLWRFFSQQFKRSCSPDGPRVGSVSLSPRGGWSAPSDVGAALWVADLDA